MAKQGEQKDWTELFRDYQSGTSMVKLVSKYRITTSRIYELLKLHGIPSNNPRKEQTSEE